MDIQLNVVLVVIAVDPKHRQNSKLLTQQNNGLISLPSQTLPANKTSRLVAGEMLEEYTGVSSNWSVLTPLGVFDDPQKEQQEEDGENMIRFVDIVYAVYIPETTRQRRPGMEWISFNDLHKLGAENLFSTDNLDMVTAAILRPI